MPARHIWTFKSRFRSDVFGWHGSHLACQRLQEAVIEIRKVAQVDPLAAADGVVILMERIWPAFAHVDTSSGALGEAINWAQSELLPLLIDAPAPRKTRDKWLQRLWQAILDDGVNYLWIVELRWGDLCGTPETASFWADRILGMSTSSWSSQSADYVRGTSVCLSSLVAAGRHRELLDVLALRRFPSWHDRQFGVQALVADGHINGALAYAEASRGLNQPNAAIDAACEKILLDAGRADEAYTKYALTANVASTGLGTFRAIARKYPRQDTKKILLDLATASADPGYWFAAAKNAGFLDLALALATRGRTNPRTLSLAARTLLGKDPQFCLEVGRLAIQRMLEGDGYGLTEIDVIDAYRHFMAAAEKLGVGARSRAELLVLSQKAHANGALFGATLVRQCSR